MLSFKILQIPQQGLPEELRVKLQYNLPLSRKIDHARGQSARGFILKHFYKGKKIKIKNLKQFDFFYERRFCVRHYLQGSYT